MISGTVTRQVRQRGVARFAAPRMAWRHLAVGGVLVLATLMNCWQLSNLGYANSYYAATVRSMLQSWHNFFFASFDPGGFVTVDKPPLGFWVQTASARLFGFHGWSLLLPEAIAGVLSVALLYYLVRRAFGLTAGLVAALALAITPISVVTNRNNTIDSLLVLTVLGAAWAMFRATETGKLRWLLASMTLVGLGFNIKMLEAYLVLPALVLVYLLGSQHRWRKRISHLAIATVVLLAISLSWATVVDLTPASQRPYVGSTTNNSELALALGYNGLQRLLGHSNGAPGSGTPGSATGQAPAIFRTASDGNAPAGFPPRIGADGGPGGPGGGNGGPGGVGENGAKGALRLLDQQLGGQIGWLLPLALLGLVGAGSALFVWPARRRWLASRPQLADKRTSEGNWSVARHVLAGVPHAFHEPLNLGQQATVLWSAWFLTMAAFFSVAGFFHRYYLSMLAPGVAALVGIAVAVLWRAYRHRQPLGWLLPVALVGTAAVQTKILRDYPADARWMTPLILGISAVAALVLVLARVRPIAILRRRLAVGAVTAGLLVLLMAPTVWAGISVHNGVGGGIPSAGPQQGQGFLSGGPGRPLPASARPSSDDGGGPGGDVRSGLLAYLEANRGDTTFLMAVPSSQSADTIIIQTGEPVMAMGGFSGTDPILTVDSVAQLVKNGTVRYFLLGGGGPGGRFEGQASAMQWVTSSCSVVPSSAYQASTASSRGGFGGAQALYDCGTTATKG